MSKCVAHIVDSNDIRIELLSQEGAAEGPDTNLDPFSALSVRGAKHIGFLVDNVDEVWKQLNSLGAELLSEPTVVEPAGVKNCFVRDPDGTMVEFDQWL
jgi:catechol 2,3-dioxygenase-like lactoylglutathione lyase family enzyme